MEILRKSALVDVPWKNGGGITRNIAVANFAARTAWRLSRADVAQDGAFSSFTGLVRILTVVSDTGMVLEHPNGTLDADPWQSVRFGGELDVFARLKDGPLSDLNLMFDPSLCEGTVSTLRGPLDLETIPPEPGLSAFHVLSGQPKLGDHSLDLGDTAFVETATPLQLCKGDAVLNIRLSYLDQSKPITFSIAAR